MIANLDSLDTVKATFSIKSPGAHQASIVTIIVAKRHWEKVGMPTSFSVDFYNSEHGILEWGDSP